jgi:hypothetical protein
MKHETINEALRAAPPVGVGGLTLVGLPLNEWLVLLTICYTIFLIVDKLPVVYARLQQFVRFCKGAKDDQESK